MATVPYLGQTANPTRVISKTTSDMARVFSAGQMAKSTEGSGLMASSMELALIRIIEARSRRENGSMAKEPSGLKERSETD